MSVKVVVLAIVIFLVILFLFNILADSSIFFRIVVSAILTMGAMYYLQCDGNKDCDNPGFGGFGGRDFTAADGST